MSRLVYLPYEFLKNETPDNVYYKAFLEGCATQLECFITYCYCDFDKTEIEVGPVLISAFNSGIFSRFGCIL